MYSLEKFGSFYIGGRNVETEGLPIVSVQRNKDLTVSLDPNGTNTIEAMYVQYFLPSNCKHLCVLIHGGGHTGAIWETTPDGREGWLHLLLKQGVGVYIVDSIERGRSAWCSLPNIWPGQPEQRTHQITWSAFRFGKQEDFEKRIAFEGQQFPIEYFDELVKYDVPRWNCNAEKSAQNLALLINKIGKCSLIAHSQGADIALQCYNKVPALIDNLVLIEPAAFPEVHVDPLHKPRVLMILGDYFDLSPFWNSIKKSAIEYLEKLKNLALDCQYLSLPNVGIKGNSHMLMMDKNNSEILHLISNWLILNKEKPISALIRSKL